jgi:NAD(P)H-nitrite reductase large subunit
MSQHTIIIGNGIAGITAARHIRKRSDCRITIISKETDHFFSRTALMYVFMGHLKYEHTKPYEDWFWEKNRLELVRGTVEKVDFSAKTIQLSADALLIKENKKHSQSAPPQLKYDSLIIATGSVPRMGDWPGVELPGVQGLYSFQDLEKLENTAPHVHSAVIVGGGLIGVELAEMLHSRGKHVTLLIREKGYWNSILPNEESQLITRHIQKHGIDLRFETELKEIAGTQRVEAIVTTQGERIDCQFVGITIGVQANVDFLRNTPLEINRGVVIDDYLKTNQPDVYAAGDCVEHRQPPTGRKAVEQIWYTGRIMGETVARTVCGEPTRYQPGVFFNSAKFFDIEYQTYGDVPAQLPDGISTFYWQHPEREICLRINYRTDNQVVTGFNNFGIRLRQESCTAWIEEKVKLPTVLAHLRDAHFDPEFYTRYEADIVAYFNTQFPNQQVMLPKKKTFWERVF